MRALGFTVLLVLLISGCDENANLGDPDGSTVPPGVCTVDAPCLLSNERCVGASCGDEWRCMQDACSGQLLVRCGCDGRSYLSGGCSSVPFEGDGYCSGQNCDALQVTCDAVPGDCPDGQTRSVEAGCWADCVPVTQCFCGLTNTCPDGASCGDDQFCQ